MDSEVTSENKDSMNASYAGKVSITFSYQANPFAESGSLMATSSSNTNAFWGYKESITKVIIEPEMTAKDTNLSFDVSEGQDESVSYLVLNEKADANEADSYTLYLQSKGGVKANSDSSYLFYSFSKLTTIEGLEYFDTSRVTNMGYMFRGCSSLTTLDLSNFDTGNVTHMGAIFQDCGSLTSLDISGFDTSNVTNMQSMFYNMPSTTIVKVKDESTQNWVFTSDNGRPSEWNTSNVIVKNI